jgi:hypothetical protein
MRERILPLPNASALAMSILSARGHRESNATRTPVACSEQSERVFYLQGRGRDLQTFEKTATRAGRILLKFWPANYQPLQEVRDISRWLWFVFDLALRDQLPTVSSTRSLWRLRGAGFASRQPWNIAAFQSLVRERNPSLRLPEDAGYWDERLRDHYLAEIADLCTTSVEAVAYLSATLEAGDKARARGESGSPPARSKVITSKERGIREKRTRLTSAEIGRIADEADKLWRADPGLSETRVAAQIASLTGLRVNRGTFRAKVLRSIADARDVRRKRSREEADARSRDKRRNR